MDDTPFHESLFNIVFGLCKEYPALSPYELEERSFYDVIALFADTRRVQIREDKHRRIERGEEELVIRRKAGDDWY